MDIFTWVLMQASENPSKKLVKIAMNLFDSE